MLLNLYLILECEARQERRRRLFEWLLWAIWDIHRSMLRYILKSYWNFNFTIFLCHCVCFITSTWIAVFLHDLRKKNRLMNVKQRWSMQKWRWCKRNLIWLDYCFLQWFSSSARATMAPGNDSWISPSVSCYPQC